MNRFLDVSAWAADRLAWSLRARGVRGTLKRALRPLRARIGLPEKAEDLEQAYRRFLRREQSRRGPSARHPLLKESADRPMVSLVAHLGMDGDLGATVRSLEAQRYSRWEMVLVGEGPAVEPVGPLTRDPRVRVEREAGGRGSALARGLAASRGALCAVVQPGDELDPDALLEAVMLFEERPDLDLVYTDEDEVDGAGHRSRPRFKPDWSPDLFDALDYVGRLAIVRRRAVEAVGGLADAPEGAEEYDLLLRVTERGPVGHVARVLYHGRAQGPFDDGAACEALRRALHRRGQAGRISRLRPRVRRVDAGVSGAPLVSLIVPTRDQSDLLRGLVESVERLSSYRRFEFLVVDNGSADPAALHYLEELGRRWRVLRNTRPFNWSALNNAAARAATGEYLVFVNNDVQVLSESWLEAMIGEAQRPEVGVVGARLLYRDHTIQHAGIVAGLGGVAGHAFRHLPAETTEPLGGATVKRNWSAVTGACMMVRRTTLEALGGFDERLAVAYNDVDFCLRARSRGLLVVYTPSATLLHLEFATRFRIDPRQDRRLFVRRWAHLLEAGDPYYNPNLSWEVGDWRAG